MDPETIEILNRHTALITDARLLAQRLRSGATGPDLPERGKVADALDALARELTTGGQSSVLAPVVSDEARALRAAAADPAKLERRRLAGLLSSLADRLMWADRHAAMTKDGHVFPAPVLGDRVGSATEKVIAWLDDQPDCYFENIEDSVAYDRAEFMKLPGRHATDFDADDRRRSHLAFDARLDEIISLNAAAYEVDWTLAVEHYHHLRRRLPR